jgi:hypothetical protein
VASEYNVPPPATIIGFFAPRRIATGVRELLVDRAGRGEAHRRRREERLGPVVRHRLHVLRHRERDRAAQRGVGQHVQRAGKRGQQLPGMHDAVEVARHRPEAVVRRHAAVVEVLDLLQHRVRRARHEDVAGQQQHRQPVDVRERGRRDHVGRARADRRRARHHAAAHVRLGEGDRRVRHRLLVVRAVGRQDVAMRVQRLAEAGDVAVAEDRPHAAEQLLAVLDAQRGEPAHERLRRGQSDRLHATLRAPPRAACHASISASNVERARGHEARVVDLALEPRARRRVEDRAADREAAAARARARLAEALGERLDVGRLPEQQHAAAVRVALGDQRVDRAPLGRAHRLELPPLGTEAQVVEALERAQHRVLVARQAARRDDLQQQLVARRLGRLAQRADLRLVLEPPVDHVVGVVRTRHLTT